MATRLARRHLAYVGRVFAHSCFRVRVRRRGRRPGWHTSTSIARLPGWLADDLTGLFAFRRDSKRSAVTDTVERVTGAVPRNVDAYLAENAGSTRRQGL